MGTYPLIAFPPVGNGRFVVLHAGDRAERAPQLPRNRLRWCVSLFVFLIFFGGFRSVSGVDEFEFWSTHGAGLRLGFAVCIDPARASRYDHGVLLDGSSRFSFPVSCSADA